MCTEIFHISNEIPEGDGDSLGVAYLKALQLRTEHGYSGLANHLSHSYLTNVAVQELTNWWGKASF